MTQFPPLGDDEQPEAPDLLTPAVETQLEALGVSIPQEIPVEDIVAAAPYAEASVDVSRWLDIPDDALRLLVEGKGYGLVPIANIGINHEGEVCDTRGSFFHGVSLGETYEPPAVTSTGNPKDLIGVKKPNVALVPPASSLYQAQAMMDGAAKYGPYNWRENPVKSMIYIAAAQRHIAAYLDGEDIDAKSGVPHLGHGLACLGILADATETGNLLDDRPAKGPAADMVRRFEDTQSFKRD